MVHRTRTSVAGSVKSSESDSIFSAFQFEYNQKPQAFTNGSTHGGGISARMRNHSHGNRVSTGTRATPTAKSLWPPSRRTLCAFGMLIAGLLIALMDSWESIVFSLTVSCHVPSPKGAVTQALNRPTETRGPLSSVAVCGCFRGASIPSFETDRTRSQAQHSRC